MIAAPRQRAAQRGAAWRSVASKPGRLVAVRHGPGA